LVKPLRKTKLGKNYSKKAKLGKNYSEKAKIVK